MGTDSSTGSILFAGLIGAVAVGTFYATLAFAGKKPGENPLAPYVPLTPERKRLVQDIDEQSHFLDRGFRLKGKTIKGKALSAWKSGDKKFVLKVSSKKFSYPYSQDAAAHFVALDASQLA